MREMNFVAVIDTSSIIWDEDDFDRNTHQYYELAISISNLMTKLKEEKPKILLRKTLQREMISSFPFGRIPHGYSDFERITFNFLTDTGSNIISYNQLHNPNISSNPNLVKSYYSTVVASEIEILITKIHTDNTKNVYFTFPYFWGSNSVLKTNENDLEEIEHTTVVVDDEKDLEKFFEQFKPIFEHSSKHDNTKYTTKEEWEKREWEKKGTVFISGLSCYDGKDNSIPQELLNTALKLGKKYYNYDLDNETYVIFQCTQDNIYHGYDEYDKHAIPNKIRKHFNI